MADPEKQNAAPPSYDSIFGELKAKKEEANSPIEFTKAAWDTCCSKAVGGVAFILMIICCTACMFGLPIAEIVIGSLYLYQCPAQRYLPIFLIVSGVFSCLEGMCSGTNRAKKRESEQSEGEDESTGGKASGCCGGLVGMFLFAWFICGNYWVFNMHPCDEPSITNSTTGCYTKNPAYQGYDNVYCKQLLFDFVYWEIVAKWIMCGVFVVFGCLACTVMCCVYCCTGGKE